MRGLLWLLAAIAIAAGLSVAIREHEGYEICMGSLWRIKL